MIHYSLVNSLVYSPLQIATLSLIKHVPLLDTSYPLSDQLHFLTLFGPASSTSSSSASTTTALSPSIDSTTTDLITRNDSLMSSSVYEGLHRLVHWGVAPAFEAFVESQGKREGIRRRGEEGKDGDGKMGIPMTKKKFAELELSLLHRKPFFLSSESYWIMLIDHKYCRNNVIVQQNVEIPDVVLSVHPAVAAAIASALASSTRPTVDLIDPSLLSDSAFLNKLQSEVNSWIKEIQNVTKLNRDVASGTASQEINFWLTMEKALEGIEEQLRSAPIGVF
jgi:dynein heavy chain 1